MNHKNKFIVIEGLDGSGKTTQARIILEKLSKLFENKVNFLSFPRYESPSSALAKMYLNGEICKKQEDVNAYAAASFYAVDRYADYKKNWENKYNNGEIFVCDRYTTTNSYYLLAKISEDEWDDFSDWHYDYEYNKLGLPVPNAVIYLNIPSDTSQNLLNERYKGDNSKKDILEADPKYQKKCEKAAKFIVKKYGWNSLECLDEKGKLKDIQAITAEILGLLEKILSLWKSEY